MTASELDVFVVQVGPTGLWDADCCNEVCGYGLHAVSEDNPTEAAAQKAATAHRAEIRKQIAEKAERAKQVEQGTAAYWQDIARQRERETRRVERDLETARSAVARLLDRMLTLEAWAHRELPNEQALHHVLSVITDLRVALDVPADGEQTGPATPEEGNPHA